MAFIQCSKCGKNISSAATFCQHCNNPISSIDDDYVYQEPERDYISEAKAANYQARAYNADVFPPNDDDEIRCPRCMSTQLTAQKKGFSAGKAVAGALLTGGIGLLAGGIGSNKVMITCLKCGNRFKPGRGF